MNILRHPATIVVLILLVVLLFGSRKLPDLARSVGESLKIFKKEVKELHDDEPTTSGAAPEAAPAQPAPSPTASPAAAQPTQVNTTQDDSSSQVPGLLDPKQPRA